MKKKILSFALIIISIAAYSQNTIDLTIRPRAIIDYGYKAPAYRSDMPVCNISQRTSAGFMHQTEKLGLYINLRDVRVWGDDDRYSASGMYGNSSSTGIHQAWVKLQISKWLSVKAGRQLLKYDDQRLLSTRNWNDYQVTYDAILITYNKNQHAFDAGLSWNSDKQGNPLYTPEKIKTLDFIHYQCKNNNLTFSAINIFSGRSESDTSRQLQFMNTFGIGIKTSGSPFTAEVYAYAQMKEGSNDPALCISAAATYNHSEKTGSLSAGTDLVSGKGQRTEAFDLLYGKRHGYYGYMDYFSNMPENGLVDYYIKYGRSLPMDLEINAHLHLFQEFTTGIGYGEEVDITASWQWSKSVNISAGYSLFHTRQKLHDIKGSSSDLFWQQFGFIMITASPKIKL